MNYGKTMMKNTIHQSLGRFLPMILSFVTGPIVARNFGSEIYGDYSTGMMLVSFFTSLFDIGLSIYIVKEGARKKEKISYILGTSIFINFLLRILVVIIILFWLEFVGYSKEIKLITYILLLGSIISSFVQILISGLQLFNKFKVISFVQIITSVISLIIAMITVQFKLKIDIFVWAQVLLSIVPFLIYFYENKRETKFEIRLDEIKEIVSKSYLFGLSGLLYILYYKLDSMMLSVFSTPLVVGEYAIAYKFVEIPLTLTSVVTIAVLSLFTKLFYEDKKLFSDYYNKLLFFMTLLGVPAGFGLYIVSESVIKLLYGESFLGASSALKIISFSVTVRFLAVIIGLIFTIGDLMNKKIKIQVAVCIINFVLNCIMIPKYGILGASMSTLITEIIILTSYIYISSRLNYKIKILKDIFIIFFNGIVMIFVVKICNPHNLFYQIILGSVTYLVFSYFLLNKKIKIHNIKNIG